MHLLRVAATALLSVLLLGSTIQLTQADAAPNNTTNGSSSSTTSVPPTAGELGIATVFPSCNEGLRGFGCYDATYNKTNDVVLLNITSNVPTGSQIAIFFSRTEKASEAIKPTGPCTWQVVAPASTYLFCLMNPETCAPSSEYKVGLQVLNLPALCAAETTHGACKYLKTDKIQVVTETSTCKNADKKAKMPSISASTPLRATTASFIVTAAVAIWSVLLH